VAARRLLQCLITVRCTARHTVKHTASRTVIGPY
jgi:hypothetical protein